MNQLFPIQAVAAALGLVSCTSTKKPADGGPRTISRASTEEAHADRHIDLDYGLRRRQYGVGADGDRWYIDSSPKGGMFRPAWCRRPPT